MNPRITDWRGKRVWVIGASTGIGRATAELLHALGATVALSARSAATLDEAVSGMARAIAVPLDVTDHASVTSAGGRIVKEWDGFDLDAANALLDLNLRGAFNCIDVALPQLLRQGSGGIGIVASVAGFAGLPKALVYGPTKAALINLSESLYLDLRPRGIAVYQINPGFVETPLTADNDFPMPALISAGDAALALVDGLEKGQFHIHFPRRFTNTLRLARLLPYRLYFWLVHKVTGL
jgi:NAD(P)-dependent dehydrogenase (short-subunit alcohol dehydrogenase family)